jgi:hypothetical protein
LFFGVDMKDRWEYKGVEWVESKVTPAQDDPYVCWKGFLFEEWTYSVRCLRATI